MTSLSIVDAREAIYLRWVTSWGTTTSFAFANEKFPPPNNAPWARITINHEASPPATLGPPTTKRKFERRGRVLVQLYDQVDQGTQSLDLLSKQAREVFEGAKFSGLDFFAADIREGIEDGEWLQFVVDAPFSYYESR